MLVIVIVASKSQFHYPQATGFLLGLEKPDCDSLCLRFRDELCKPPLLSMRGFLRSCLWVLSPALTHKITITWFICLPPWKLHRWTFILNVVFFFNLLDKVTNDQKVIICVWAVPPWSQLQSGGSGSEAEKTGGDVSVGGAPGEQVSPSAFSVSLRWL